MSSIGRAFAKLLVKGGLSALDAAVRLDPRALDTKRLAPESSHMNLVRRDERTYGNYVSRKQLYQPWIDDPGFRAVWEQIEEHTLLDIQRSYVLWEAVRQVSHLDGGIVEVGTFRGGSGCLLAARAQDLELDARTYLCDTFEGVVKASPEDSVYEGGELADSSPEVVGELADKMGVDPTVLEGVFPDETANRVEEDAIRLVHIDVDVYEGTKEVFDWGWPKLERGGAIVIDDYGSMSTPGVTLAIDEESNRADSFMQHLINTQAILIKTG